MSTLYTPMIEHVFDTFFAYGLVEAAWRGGIEKGELIPRYPGYAISFYTSKNDLAKCLREGIEELLKDLEIEIKSGINIDICAIFTQKNAENYLKDAKDAIERAKDLIEVIEGRKKTVEKTIYVALAPSLGKYQTGLYASRGRPLKADIFYIILSILGIHYYVPITKSVGERKAPYILMVPCPLEPMSLLEVISLRELKIPGHISYIGREQAGRKAALLHELTRCESIGSLEEIRRKLFQMIVYELIPLRGQGTYTIRRYEEYKLTKLANFLWELKRVDLKETYDTVHKILSSEDSDLPSLFIDSVLYDHWEDMYAVLRKLASSQRYFVDVGLADAINKWFLNR